MIKLIYISLIISVSRALEINLVKGYNLEVQKDVTTRSIGAVNSITTIFRGPPLRVEVIWKPLPSPPSNPIRGYYVKLWIQKTRIVQSLELIYGKYVTIKREEPIAMPPASIGGPDWDPLEVITVPGSANNIAEFHNLLVDRWYEIRIQAYTLTEVGSYSFSLRYIFHYPDLS